MMNWVIALACAVEPLAFNACLPPQATFTAVAYGGVDFSLTHADRTNMVAASKLSAAEDRFSAMLTVIPPLVDANAYCWVVLARLLV
jgi:hypothetical protein